MPADGTAAVELSAGRAAAGCVPAGPAGDAADTAEEMVVLGAATSTTGASTSGERVGHRRAWPLHTWSTIADTDSPL